MSGTQKILVLCGLTEKDAVVVVSLLDLLADRMSYTWRVDNAHRQPDCILCDLDGPEGRAAWDADGGRTKRRIALTTTQPPPADAQHVLHKPIRASKLVEALENDLAPAFITPPPEAASSLSPGELVRLKRWPNQGLIKGYPALLRLSALLTQRTLSISRAAEIARTDLQTTLQFIELCQRHGWLVTQPQPEAESPEASRSGERRSLLARIRSRLGLRN